MFRGLISPVPPTDMDGGFGRGGTLSLMVHVALIGAAVLATRHATKIVKITPMYIDGLEWIPEARTHRGSDLPWGLRAMFPLINQPLVPPVNIPPIEGINPALDMSFLAGVARDTNARVLGIFSNPGQLYLESVVDEKPECISSPMMEYPDLLRQAGIEGGVTLEVIIDTTGHTEPGSVRTVGATNRAFEAAARRAVLQSVFRPGRVRGQPVRVLVQIPVTFTIRH